MNDWLRRHVYPVHWIAFLLMILPPIPMYLAARRGSWGWVVICLSMVVLGNILAMLVR